MLIILIKLVIDYTIWELWIRLIHKKLKFHLKHYIYTRFSHRLGLYLIKTELEDLGLKHTVPDEYKDIAQKLKETKEDRNRYIRKFIRPIRSVLKEKEFSFEIKGRPKSIYSIRKKMINQKIDYENVFDKFAIRIIIDTPREREKSDCWRIYSFVTDFYKPNPDRLRDWISTSKSNGYESLHTTVMGPDGNGWGSNQN